MRIASSGLWRPIAISLAITLAVPFGEAGTPSQQASSSAQSEQVNTQATVPVSDAASPAQPQEIPDSPAPAAPVAADHQQATLQQEAGGQQQTGPREPVGTAAAPSIKPVGVPASRPAGAAIAPAKQKRRSSIGIKLGLLVATGVAVGTVVGLSSASSSHPH